MVPVMVRGPQKGQPFPIMAEIKLVSLKGHEFSAPFEVLKYSKFVKDIVDQDPGACAAAPVTGLQPRVAVVKRCRNGVPWASGTRCFFPTTAPMLPAATGLTTGCGCLLVMLSVQTPQMPSLSQALTTESWRW